MLAVNQGKAEKSIHRLLQDLGVAFLAPLALIGNRLGFYYKVICWFRVEMQRRALISELSRLNEHYLRDVGIERVDIDLIAAETVKRLRKGGDAPGDHRRFQRFH